ncbi:hypothetical protein CDAR_573641 [Caerostris darwini]|nr:hypothetical protein CDAR_573641 [Caerostris darwini]
MGDLLHEAKPTPLMSTFDLKACYDQVKVLSDVQGKTVFVCLFGTYSFKRMPFGLRNAPTTFQRYIQNFADISRPFRDLTKKKSLWNWGFHQQTAFETLKKCPMKQVDGTTPYIARTDASNYALGTVSLRSAGSEEHPIEYASRLITQTEHIIIRQWKEKLSVLTGLLRNFVDT